MPNSAPAWWRTISPASKDFRSGLIGFGTIGRAVAQAFIRMGAKVCILRSGGEFAARRRARDVAGRFAVDLRCCLAACAAAAGDAEPDRRRASLSRMKAGAVLIQASRGGIIDEAALAASLTAGRISAAPPSTSIRPSLPRPTIRCWRSPARLASRLHLDPAHRGCHAPGFGVSVPLGVAERRTGAGAATAAAQPGVLSYFFSAAAAFATGAPALDILLQLLCEFLRRAADHVVSQRLDARLHLRRGQDGDDLVVQLR